MRAGGPAQHREISQRGGSEIRKIYDGENRPMHLLGNCDRVGERAFPAFAATRGRSLPESAHFAGGSPEGSPFVNVCLGDLELIEITSDEKRVFRYRNSTGKTGKKLPCILGCELLKCPYRLREILIK